MLLTPAQIKPKSFESRRNLFFFFFFFFLPGADESVFTWVPERYAASAVLSVPTLRACVPKVPESGARSVIISHTTGAAGLFVGLKATS